MRITTIAVGAVATYIAITVTSIYGLFLLCADLVYVVLFPQLICVVHWPSRCNHIGALCGFVVGLGVRLLSGEPLIGLAPVLLFPNWREADPMRGETVAVQRFPFRTAAMLTSLLLIVVGSWLAERFGIVHAEQHAEEYELR